MVSEELAPGEAEVGGREGRATGEGRKRGGGLGGDEAPLGTLVRLLQVHPRRVDAAEHVRFSAAEQLALVRREAARARGVEVLVDRRDPEALVREQARQLRLDRRVVRAVEEEHVA